MEIEPASKEKLSEESPQSSKSAPPPAFGEGGGQDTPERSRQSSPVVVLLEIPLYCWIAAGAAAMVMWRSKLTSA